MHQFGLNIHLDWIEVQTTENDYPMRCGTCASCAQVTTHKGATKRKVKQVKGVMEKAEKKEGILDEELTSLVFRINSDEIARGQAPRRISHRVVP